MVPPSPEIGPSLAWYRRFCMTSPIHVIQQQPFVAPHRDRFLSLMRQSGDAIARTWLFGSLIHEAVTKTEALRSAAHPEV